MIQCPGWRRYPRVSNYRLAGVKLVRLRQSEVCPQQIGHGTLAEPIAVQLPLAARRDQPIRDQHLQDLVPSCAPRLRRGKLLRLGGRRSAQKRSNCNACHNCPASQQAPHWRGRHSRRSDRRSCTTDASGAMPAQRSSGNSAIVRGCPASSSSTSIALRHTAACEELISPKYSTWRCTTRPPATRLFSTTLQ